MKSPIINDLPRSETLDSSAMATIQGGTNPTEAISFNFGAVEESSTSITGDNGGPSGPDPIRFYFGWR